MLKSCPPERIAQRMGAEEGGSPILLTIPVWEGEKVLNVNGDDGYTTL